jgi:hypothetical protein
MHYGKKIMWSSLDLLLWIPRECILHFSEFSMSYEFWKFKWISSKFKLINEIRKKK